MLPPTTRSMMLPRKKPVGLTTPAGLMIPQANLALSWVPGIQQAPM